MTASSMYLSFDLAMRLMSTDRVWVRAAFGVVVFVGSRVRYAAKGDGVLGFHCQLPHPFVGQVRSYLLELAGRFAHRTYNLRSKRLFGCALVELGIPGIQPA